MNARQEEQGLFLISGLRVCGETLGEQVGGQRAKSLKNLYITLRRCRQASGQEKTVVYQCLL